MCGHGAAAWIARTLVVPDTQGELVAMGAGDMLLLGWFFLASGSSGPVERIEHGGGTAAWITGTLGGTKCAGMMAASGAGAMAL